MSQNGQIHFKNLAKKKKKFCFNELFSLKLINLCAFRHTRQFSFSLTLVFYAK